MTNITLSIENSVYKRLKKHSEIKWSEFVRRIIKQRLDELDKMDKHHDKESILTMLASENILKKEWDNEEDERWNNL
ncbi:hypothetical protein CL617_00285 [archaeon]|nr:hypothetical protein [archaeon]|tara:strand:+ start:3500 stop:3730 length:231 start_codon:yes stop_codon:yes gene_type:complete